MSTVTSMLKSLRTSLLDITLAASAALLVLVTIATLALMAESIARG